MEIPSHKFEKISSPSSQDFTAANTLWPHSDRNGTEKGGSDLNSSWYERAKWKFPVTNSKKYLPHLLKTLRPQIPSGPIPTCHHEVGRTSHHDGPGLPD